jgi:peroxiredoxin (alkyl hydroperoxide reductase subunit C)
VSTPFTAKDGASDRFGRLRDFTAMTANSVENLAMNQENLFEVDWSKIPAPVDDGAARHLLGRTIPPLDLVATDNSSVRLSALKGRTVVFAYPRTGEPGKISPVDDWDMIPGARGCTPQACAFRDLFAELKAAGAGHVFGLSTQDPHYQCEMAARLHLPFAVLSDEGLSLTRALELPTMEVAGLTLIRRLTLVIDGGRINHVFYPVFPPDRNAGEVLAWLRANPVSQ